MLIFGGEFWPSLYSLWVIFDCYVILFLHVAMVNRVLAFSRFSGLLSLLFVRACLYLDVDERVYSVHCCYLHRESKKQDTKLLAITSPTIIRFSNFYTSGLGSKFATNSYLNVPPRFKHVATLPCEIWMSENGIILKYVLQLMMNQKLV